MNLRTAEVRRLAPIAYFLSNAGFVLLCSIALLSILNIVHIIELASPVSFLIVGAMALTAYLIGRIRLSVVNAKLERQFNNAG